MEIEVATLKQMMEEKETVTRAGMEFCLGKLRGFPAVVVRSGVGKVNAAVCTQILIDRFKVDAVVNTGVAGSLDADIDIGDIVVSSDVMHHDVDATLFGYAPGEVPQLGVEAFTADDRLIGLVIKACSHARLPLKVHKGRVVSGDQFIFSREKKEDLARIFKARCTEMEGAAIAQTAWLSDIPFVIVRAISDKADESAKMDYPSFEVMAAERSVSMICALMELMAQDKSC